MPKEYNPYYAYIELDIGEAVINNIDNGAISLQATYKDAFSCSYIVELYDATAHRVAELIMDSGDKDIRLRYGYTDDDSIKASKCSLSQIHTEFNGHGEILTLEMVAEDLFRVVDPSASIHTRVNRYQGRVSDILRQVLSEIGWEEGTIVDTVDGIRGENNGNDDITQPKDYYYWDSDQTVIDFMLELQKYAVSESGEGDYVLHAEYYEDTPPVVDFYPKSYSDKDPITLTWVYGDPESEIITVDVDWGTALAGTIGAKGSNKVNLDSVNNEITGTEQTVGYPQEEVMPSAGAGELTPMVYSGKKLTPRLGFIQGPQGTETYYGGLPFSSSAFTKTIQNHPEMKNWAISYRQDGVMTFGNYVVVAGSISGNYEDGKYHEGTHQRGDIVKTSLGEGIVIDGCYRSVTSSNEHFDISVSKKAQYGWYKSDKDY